MTSTISTAPSLEIVARFRCELDRLAGDLLCENSRIGLAVSGGPDSLALLLLAHAALPGHFRVATVDHGLRPEAEAEAAHVAGICADRTIPHATLRAEWSDRPGESTQQRARALRYGLLERWCRAKGLLVLLTAHHRDDQAETLLMRLARGAGVAGLAGVRASRSLGSGDPQLRLVRPLLHFTRGELVEIVAQAGLDPVDDPSNHDPRHDRTVARALLAETGWLRADRIAASAVHLAGAETALLWAADTAYRDYVSEHGEWLVLDPSGLPDEIIRRLLLKILYALDENATPSGPDTMRMIARLRAGEAATLGEVQARGGATWRFRRAPPRRTTVPGWPILFHCH